MLVMSVPSAVLAQSHQEISVDRYTGWIPTGFQDGIDVETSQEELAWSITEKTISKQHRPYYRGYALERFGTIKTIEFEYEVTGTPEGSVRLELWDGLGRKRLWNKAIKETGTQTVTLDGRSVLYGLEFRLVPNAQRLKPDVSVRVRHLSFTETDLPHSNTLTFSGDDFVDWTETNIRGSVKGSSDDGLFFKTTRRVANKSNGWARGFKKSLDYPLSKISFEYSSSANKEKRMILELLDGRGHLIWSRELKKGKTKKQEVSVVPGGYARGGLEFRLRKNDYIIYGGNTATVDHVKVTMVKSRSDMADKLSERVRQKGRNFVNNQAVRLAHHPLPHHALPQGNIKVAEKKGVEPGQKGYLAGRFMLFHQKDAIRLKGSGYFRIRWEVEHWVCSGRIIDPTIKGDIVPLGEGDGYNTGGGKSYPIVGPKNKYYYMNGEAYIQVNEGNACYNLSVTRTNYRSVINGIKRVF